MTYTIQIEPSVTRFLKKLRDAKLVERLTHAIYALETDPRPHNCKRLQGDLHDLLCIRVGDYRILYRVVDRELVIVVMEIGNRREVYR